MFPDSVYGGDPVFVAADYPFLDVLWTMLVFFAWVIWFWMLIVILSDVFRRRDIGDVSLCDGDVPSAKPGECA